MPLYPVNLNIAKKLCIVIGGGNVAVRKVRSLVECRASVIVISPVLCEDLAILHRETGFTWYERGYQEGDLQGAILCIAATDNRDVQQAVTKEAVKENVLINSIDDPEVCDFQVPSKLRRGDLLLTVSTKGASPALSRVLRKKLEQEFGVEYEPFVFMLQLIRKQIVGSNSIEVDHQLLFREVVQYDFLPLFKAEKWTEIERVLNLILPNEIDVAFIMGNLMKKIEQQHKIN